MQNFFEHQDRAKRNTRTLLTLMAIGVLGLACGLYVMLVVFEWMLAAVGRAGAPSLVQPQLLLATLTGTALVVGLASGARVLSLRGGGRSIAELLGGRLINASPSDPLEKRLVNVVEEMAIASGVPVPQVFVLDGEPGINAFAAGHTFDDAAIAVTRGCLESLTRDELQGVVAHEFSHVLHGDMRLNINLMGGVFGIVCIGLLGRLLMRAGFRAHVGGSRRNQQSAGPALVVLGLGVMLLGLFGELCGKLIKAAVNRQREFLADASAVQFTRNPAGIAGALKKIGGARSGTLAGSARAEEASHFFFTDIRTHMFAAGWLSTHPPLEERIRRLEPGFVPDARTSLSASPATYDARVSGLAPALSAQVGRPGPAALAAGERLLHSLPAELREAAQSPYAACAIVYGMLLAEQPDTLQIQLRELEAHSGAALRDETRRLRDGVRALPRESRLPLLELLAPALRELSDAQRAAFMRTLQALIAADRKMSIFEYVLSETLRRRLARASAPRTRGAEPPSLAPFRTELELALSLLAHAGASDAQQAGRAFAAATARLSGLSLSLLPADPRLLSGLSVALEKLEGLGASHKAAIVEACAEAVLSDQAVGEDELSLLRAVCDALGCPLPLRVELHGALDRKRQAAASA